MISDILKEDQEHLEVKSYQSTHFTSFHAVIVHEISVIPASSVAVRSPPSTTTVAVTTS